MHIHLPNSAFLGNIDTFIKDLDLSNPHTLHLTANKKWISVHPLVLAMTAAIGRTLSKTNIRSETFEAASQHYFDRMHLFTFLGIKPQKSITSHDPAGRFIPLTQITNTNQLTTFITEMIPLLHLAPKQVEPLRYIISELVRNVLEHAASPHGAIVCAQYYAKSNTIRIGLADTGVGIKKTITHSHPASTHLDAIRLALMPGITGTTRKEGGTEYNAGAGLFFIKSIATVNRDFFVIYSGNALYKLLKSKAKKNIQLHADPFQDRHSAAATYPFWQGTVVGIDISLNATHEFTQLLDAIQKTYIQTIKERKKERYRRAQFI